MKRTVIQLIVSVAILSGWSTSAELPKGWFAAGSRPKDYEMGIDQRNVHDGKSSARIKSVAAKPSGFGTLMQTFKADAYRGRRVLLSGYVRPQTASEWAGLWMRVDGPKGESLAFDNMQQRPIKGTTDWMQYEIVLDVPSQAEQIACGLLLSGRGEAWMDGLRIGTTTKEPTASAAATKQVPDAPVNLDFEND